MFPDSQLVPHPLARVYQDAVAQALFEEYERLSAWDNNAFEQLEGITVALVQDGMSYEQRVKKFGQAHVDRQWSPYLDALASRKSAASALCSFRRRHPLIAAVADAEPRD